MNTRMSGNGGPGLLQRIRQRAASHPDTPALLHGDTTVRYGDLPRLVQAMAEALLQYQVRAGDSIGLSMDHTPLHAVALLALLSLGALVVPLSPSLDAPMRERLARKYGLRRLVLDHPVAPIPDLPLVMVSGITARKDHGGDSDYQPLPDTAARLAFTSGTTGEPKAVLHTHDELLRRALRSTEGWNEATRLSVPRLHITVATASLLGTLCRGGAVVFPWGRSFDDLVLALEKQAVSHLLLPPAAALEVAARLPHRGLPALRQLRLAGAMPTPAQLERLTRCTPHLIVTYALTELGLLALATPELLSLHPYGAMRVCEGVRLEVVDPQGRPLPPGERGEIRAVGVPMPASYYGMEPQNPLRFRECWFHTGDVGRLSAEGLLWIEGRNDEMLNFGGHKLLPSALEASLLSLPQVLQAAVFTATGADGAERLAAALVAAPGYDAATLAAQCRELLGIDEPHRLLLLPELPRNEMGKLRRGELRRMAEARRP